jgi:aspartyl-tRNA(Asn)/glutamyl-tRNA(Gln) amidotransferase subunit C
MKITREMLDKIAHLARLEFDESEAQKMMDDMTTIVNWMEELNAVNTDGVEPLTTLSHEINAMREDRVVPQLTHEAALDNAPDKDNVYFRVPKVLG